jgi:hypothetical protein
VASSCARLTGGEDGGGGGGGGSSGMVPQGPVAAALAWASDASGTLGAKLLVRVRTIC